MSCFFNLRLSFKQFVFIHSLKMAKRQLLSVEERLYRVQIQQKILLCINFNIIFLYEILSTLERMYFAYSH